MRNQIIDNENNQGYAQATLSKTFMSNVFMYMFVAMALSGSAAYVFGTSSLSDLLYTRTYEGVSRSIFGMICMWAPLGLVLLMGVRFKKFSYASMLGVFILFSVLIGISISSIFLTYSMASILLTFVVTGGTFGIMAVLGYTTDTDLTKFGSILKMALIGLIIAMLANYFFIKNAGILDYVISGLGVLIFTGLTAYDTQKLKNIGAVVDANSEEGKKLAIHGALSLYLDFINLFLFLLRFLGRD